MKTIDISKIVLFIMSSFFMMSCEDDLESEGVSRVTYYPTFNMQGSPEVFLSSGATFADPGVTATEDGKSLEVSTSVVGRYFGYSGVSVPDPVPADVYLVNYSAKNSDGFDGTTGRMLYVAKSGDLVSSIEGVYTSTVVRNEVSAAPYTEMKYIVIKDNGDGTYNISDGIGGYYDFGRGYGDAYAAKGVKVTANDIAANDFTYPAAFPVGLFGGTAEMSGMTVDPTNKTITFSTEWSFGFTFVVTLKQVNS